MTFVILRHALAKIMGGISNHFQQVNRQSHYSDVGKLDDEISNFVLTLPPHLSMEHPDTSFDQTHPYIPWHRFLLVTEIMFVRITLHRPYLLRRLDSDRFLRSRKACFESALKDFEVRQAFRKLMSKERRESIAIGYREFQAAMISAIYLVLNPKGSDAPAMLAVMDAFLRDHKLEDDTDETTLREVKTIEFLRSKALRLMDDKMTIDSQTSLDGGPATSGPHPEAHLLLGLQQHNILASFPSITESLQTPYGLTNSPRAMSTFSPQISTPVNESPDDSTAQSLLDLWCNTVGPGSMMDGSSAGISWGMPAGTDPTGWSSTTPFTGSDSQIWGGSGIGGTSDLSYWETLVDQIKNVPS